MFEFLKIIIRFLQEHNIPYMLSGSVALSIYTLPRATRDFDFIIHLQPKDVQSLIDTFKEGYYCNADAINDAITHQSMFNIIDHSSGFKADFVILKNEPFRQVEFNRRIEIEFEGMKVFVVSPEDLLISKLIWIQDFQSSIQIQDIKTLSQKDSLDWKYINSWVQSLGLNTFSLLNNE